MTGPEYLARMVLDLLGALAVSPAAKSPFRNQSPKSPDLQGREVTVSQESPSEGRWALGAKAGLDTPKCSWGSTMGREGAQGVEEQPCTPQY